MALVSGNPTTQVGGQIKMPDQQKGDGRIPLVTHIITDDDLGLLQVGFLDILVIECLTIPMICVLFTEILY